MATDKTAALLVARFLRSNHYDKTLEAFLREANLSESDAITSPDDWTLEKLVNEKTQFDVSLKFERRDKTANQAWTEPAPSLPSESSVPITSNVLSVMGRGDGESVMFTTAQNTSRTLTARRPHELCTNEVLVADSPILSTVVVSKKRAFAACMSGKLICYDTATNAVLGEARCHNKWAVQVVAISSDNVEGRRVVATAGWDQKVNLHLVDVGDNDSSVEIPSPFHTITTTSNPESIIFVKHPDTQETYLVISRRDSTFIYYYRLVSSGMEDRYDVQEAGRQNLAPHSNAWVAFTPCSLRISPEDSTLMAVATSHIPHLRVIVVRLLFPGDAASAPQAETVAAVARANLALQDREDAAIKLQVSTMAPQTPYSTPQVVWRPDASGLWVNGDDGVIRGVEAKTGKVVTMLKGHESGSKVRTLWAGRARNDKGEMVEMLVSGGFDKKLIFWNVEK